jgi:hypothetical protein
MRQAALANASGVSREDIARLELSHQDPTWHRAETRHGPPGDRRGIGGVGRDAHADGGQMISDVLAEAIAKIERYQADPVSAPLYAKTTTTVPSDVTRITAAAGPRKDVVPSGGTCRRLAK